MLIGVLVSGCEEGISDGCINLVDEANTYCNQFLEQECTNQKYEHQTQILPNPIDCVWSEKQSLCKAGEGCD